MLFPGTSLPDPEFYLVFVRFFHSDREYAEQNQCAAEFRIILIKRTASYQGQDQDTLINTTYPQRQ